MDSTRRETRPQPTASGTRAARGSVLERRGASARNRCTVNYIAITRAFVVALLAATILASLVASRVSVGLVLLVVIAIPLAALWLAHNHNPLTARFRERDDELLFRGCEGGAFGIRRLYRRLPADPRCRLCLVPFGGVGKVLRISPSRKNPNFCRDCLDSAPVGVYEMEVGVLFADIRGFTAWSERRRPDEVAAALTEFYALASRVLTRDDALVEFVGDQVMALYLPNFPSLRERTARVMVSAARRLVHEMHEDGPEGGLRIGVGIHMGVASVGNVGKGEIKDFTAVGDVVNTTARLQGCALGGQIIVSDAVYERAEGSLSRAEAMSLSVKGKSDLLHAYVIDERGAAAHDAA